MTAEDRKTIAEAREIAERYFLVPQPECVGIKKERVLALCDGYTRALDEVERLRRCRRCNSWGGSTPCAYPMETAREQHQRAERLAAVARAVSARGLKWRWAGRGTEIKICEDCSGESANIKGAEISHRENCIQHALAALQPGDMAEDE